MKGIIQRILVAITIGLLFFVSSDRLLVEAKDTFSQLSDSAFSDIHCVPYAYGDFNADKRIDIFCVSKSGHQIEIWLAQEKEPLFSSTLVFQLKNSDALVVNIVPGDFNGDSMMDIIVVYTTDKFSTYKMSLYLGNKTSRYNNDLEAEQQIELTIVDQPFVADFDGDGKLDLMVQQTSSSKIEFYTFGLDGTLIKLPLTYPSSDQLAVGYAHAIADMNHDSAADLIVTVKVSGSAIKYQVLGIDLEKNQYKMLEEYATPSDSYLYGQSLFADFDSDGHIEHLLPACKDLTCDKSAIFVRKDSKWDELPIDFSDHGFIAPSSSGEFWGPNLISLKAGDYNLNGFVDLLAVLTDRRNASFSNDKYPILLQNVPRDSPSSGNATTSFDRNFHIDKKISSLFAHSNVIQASFFDLFDNGYLDILLVLKEHEQGSSEEFSYKLIALKNDNYDDVYFMKVMVIPGICNVGRCPFQSLPYGLNYAGAMIKIETTSYEYQRVVAYASQLSQSAYMALQMPYIIFGIGTTPNFVEHLTVSILAKASGDLIKPQKKEWPQIIPNSQLVVSPNPRHMPYYWKMQLFITPSKNILMTGVALLVTIFCLVILISVLQYKERKMDDKERKLESQRFHFDGL